MSEVKKKKKKRLSKSGLVLIIGIAIIIIPCIIFASILGIAALQTGSPREGSRFENDFVYEITSDQVKSIETNLNSLSNIEKVSVKVSEGQLKIYIDCIDSTTSEEIDKILTDAYSSVNSVLPISTYFTINNEAKMYDLQINAYTTLEASDSREYKLLHKNSAEETYQIDDMAHAKDPALVSELLGETTEEEPQE